MTAPLRLGLLSTARINGAIVGGARLTDRVDVVAVASRDAARAEAHAREHGIPRAHHGYEALLADPEVDAVYVSLPNGLHHEWTTKALEAGKHVLCEKPYSRRPEEVESAFALADRERLVLMEAFMWRHHPQTRRLVELVAAGEIGELRLVRAAFSFRLADPADVRLRADLDGGALMDVGCYCVSAARLLCGEPEHVTGSQVTTAEGVDMRFAGTLAFPGDVLAHFDCAFDLQARGELEVCGAEGTLVLADPFHARRPGIVLRRGGDARTIRVPAADAYRLQLENLADAAAGTAAPLLGRADALGQAQTIEALYRAAGGTAA